jgi:fructose-specific component phosphotransferase system IIB-like protein
MKTLLMIDNSLGQARSHLAKTHAWRCCGENRPDVG